MNHSYLRPLSLEPPSHFPPHPTPLGCHRALGLSSLCHLANSHWLSILYGNGYVSVLFSQVISPPPPPLCLQVCSLCLHPHSIQFKSVAQSCLTLCDPMNRSMPGLPVHHQLPEFTQTHVHRADDAI